MQFDNLKKTTKGESELINQMITTDCRYCIYMYMYYTLIYTIHDIHVHVHVQYMYKKVVIHCISVWESLK